MHVAVAPPWRDLVAGRPSTPMSARDVAKAIAQVPPPLGDVPLTVVIMSTSGFTADARKMAEHAANRYVILVESMPTGGWVVHTPPELADIAEVFDLEAARINASTFARPLKPTGWNCCRAVWRPIKSPPPRICRCNWWNRR